MGISVLYINIIKRKAPTKAEANQELKQSFGIKVNILLSNMPGV